MKKKICIILLIVTIVGGLILYLNISNNQIEEIDISEESLTIVRDDTIIDNPFFFIENSSGDKKDYEMSPKKIDISTVGKQDIVIKYKEITRGFTITIVE